MSAATIPALLVILLSFAAFFGGAVAVPLMLEASGPDLFLLAIVGASIGASPSIFIYYRLVPLVPLAA